MATKIMLASGDRRTLDRFSQVLAEAEGFTLVQAVQDAAGIDEALARTPDVDVLVVDVALDGGRGLAVVRGVGATNPLLGLAVLVDQAGPEELAAAMESGARSVLSRASSLAEVVARLESVAQWVGSARAAVSSDVVGGRSGRVVAVAGAKGGVGTSAVALLVAQSLVGTRGVGLVDMDLQSGDLAAYLGVHARRSVVDLVDVAGEMTGRVLRETSYDVPGGLRLLAAPDDGEREEEMTARAARSVLNALRFQHDLSVVDVGSHLTEATAAVLEDADEVLLVATPDLPALRAARRTLTMWERLEVRARAGVRIVLNRQSRRHEVTETLAAKIVESTVSAVVPEGGTSFEQAMNTATLVAASGPAHTAAARLAARVADAATAESGTVDEAVGDALAQARGRRRRRDAGQAAVELPVVFAVAMLVLLVAAQGLVWGTGFLLARAAAQEGARTVGREDYGPAVVAQARDDAVDTLEGPWRSGADVDVSSAQVRVSIDVPSLVPGVHLTSSVAVPVFEER